MGCAPFSPYIIEHASDYLVVDKPPGLLVHPTKPGGPVTLWDHLRLYLAYELANGGQVSLINRLDRETSGLILVALTAERARDFSMAMAARRIHKKYLALSLGWPVWDSCTVDKAILRQGIVRPSRVWLERCVDDAGEQAVTELKVLERRQRADGLRFSLIEAQPLTGRTHQIRVHLAWAGYPVVGDKIYADSSERYLEFIEHGWTPDLQQALHLPRHALHSAYLSVELDGKLLAWESPLAGDLQDWMSAGVLHQELLTVNGAIS